MQINLGGSFYNLIKSLYSKSSCSIKIDQYQTRPFQYTRGVRQGCILSPLLFNLYINDLPFSFENILSDPFVLPNGTKLNALLQNCLNTLATYCNTWMSSVNPKKNKIMVFQKRAKKCSERTFYIGNQAIDVVQDYTYLGTKISSSGNFKISLDHLKEKALHALFSRRYTNFSKLKPSLACKTFDTMISPILLYNSEIWGGYVKADFKAWDGSQIERTHLQFCKRYLEVSNKASNVACRAELGRFPLLIDINQRILNYLLYLQNKQPDSFVRQSFLISSELHTAGKNSFYPNLMKISEYFNFGNFSPDLVDTAKVTMFLQLMKQKYISYTRIL